MTPEKKEKYKKDLADAKEFYRNTDMSISQIARLLKLSPTKVSNMLDGKHPKYYKERDYVDK